MQKLRKKARQGSDPLEVTVARFMGPEQKWSSPAATSTRAQQWQNKCAKKVILVNDAEGLLRTGQSLLGHRRGLECALDGK
jgi:hypothetical protein